MSRAYPKVVKVRAKPTVSLPSPGDRHKGTVKSFNVTSRVGWL
jgi:hypothetical protein